MAEHEPCPQCGRRPTNVPMYEDSEPGRCVGFVAGCLRHWRGPVMPTSAEALDAWDRVMGPYWDDLAHRAEEE